METLFIFVIAVVVVIVFKMTRKKATFDASPEATKLLADNSELLERRWARAAKEDESKSLSEFQDWYFDEPSDSQIDYLKDLGITRFPKKLSKGQVSDLIGLFGRPENEEMLKF